MVELLIRHRTTATGPTEATAALQSIFGAGISMRQTDVGDPFAFALDALIDDSVSFTRIVASGGSVVAAAADLADLVVLAPREGIVQMRRGDETVVVDPEWLGIVPIGQSLELSWENAQIDAVSFPRTALSRLLGADIDPQGLDVGRLTPESPAIVKLWRHLAACLVTDVLSNRELYESDMVRDQAVQALLGVTIEAFSISDTSEDDLSDRGIVRRSEEFMLSRIGEPISVSHIARAAGVSIRGLQLAYRKTGLGTPIAHLRSLRMTAARDRLMRADARRVNQVARDLGYTNLGRFSAHYREAHGEQPIETLRSRNDPMWEPTS